MLFAIALIYRKDNKTSMIANLAWAPTEQEALKAVCLKIESEGYEVLHAVPCQATSELINQIVKDRLLSTGQVAII